MAYVDTRHPALLAAKAHTDMNIFAAVQILMEGSLVSSRHQEAAARIMRICREEQQKCLADYEAAMAAAKSK